MKAKFLTDENVAMSVIKMLRNNGYGNNDRRRECIEIDGRRECGRLAIFT